MLPLRTAHASYSIPASHDAVADVDTIIACAIAHAHAAFPNARAVVAYDVDCGPSSASRGAHDLELEIVHEFTPAFADALGALTIVGTSDAGAFDLDPQNVAFTQG